MDLTDLVKLFDPGSGLDKPLNDLDLGDSFGAVSNGQSGSETMALYTPSPMSARRYGFTTLVGADA